ncbi:unnamed protein product [Bursaphelenchus xylophilus]|uniref:(pine wood nematode) hypothetical protein n=1 Tax=Bursaphelenchus xylophilus TaxID=6326 RepID=A0A1I7SUP9_BURXY|nr:unnamed protein product [Bursaphelenchus xylophilus]CAG9125967.1 unnamed protein product [Bursaphelenchus xylophilus]
MAERHNAAEPTAENTLVPWPGSHKLRFRIKSASNRILMRNYRWFTFAVLKLGPIAVILVIVFVLLQSHLYTRAGRRSVEKVENCLLVDADCLQNLAKKLPCKTPLKCAMTGPTRSRNVVTEYLIEDDLTKKYFTLVRAKFSANLTMSKRLLPRFDVTPYITVPTDSNTFVTVRKPPSLEWFNFHWPRSEFMDCLNVTMDRNVSARLIPLEKIGLFDDIRQRGEKFDVTVFLIGGTLLGWFRECDIIPHTHDIDFAIRFNEYKSEFFKYMDGIYRRRFRAGRIESGLEISYHIWGNVRADFFMMYRQNKTTEYIAGMLPWKRQAVRYFSPKVTKLCSGDLHGQLVYVPCNTIEILESTYGPDWMHDVPTNSYNYASSTFNTELGEVFSEAEWLAVWNEFYDKETPKPDS